MSAGERRPPGGGASEPFSSARGRDEAKSGFGSTRWAEGPYPTAPRDDEAGYEKSGFGGSSWGSSADVPADDVEDGAAEGSQGRRRREPPGPKYPRRTVAALGAAAEVIRDEAGIPHVFAKRERDAYAALGFCMAEDRLVQMDLHRRIACGRAAEILGPSAERLDALVRTIGIPRRAAGVGNRLDGAAREALAAFAGGVNAGRAHLASKEAPPLGYALDPWTVADSLAIELYLAWARGVEGWAEKLRVASMWATEGGERARYSSRHRLDAVSPDVERLALWGRIDRRLLDLLREAFASLAATPVATECAGYVSHLEAPDFQVIGVSHVGLPGIVIGRNANVAWATSAACVDDADCVIEELDGIGHFRTESGWAKLGSRRELVRVRGGESRKLEVVETRNGPLLSHLLHQLDGASEGRPVSIALRWGPIALTTSLGGLLAFARARSVADIERASRALDRASVPIAIVAVDRAGDTYEVVAGAVPVREGAAALPVRGWVSEARWSALTGLSTRGTGGARPAGSASLERNGGDADRPSVAVEKLGRLQAALASTSARVSIDAAKPCAAGEPSEGAGLVNGASAGAVCIDLELGAKPKGEIVELVPG